MHSVQILESLHWWSVEKYPFGGQHSSYLHLCLVVEKYSLTFVVCGEGNIGDEWKNTSLVASVVPQRRRVNWWAVEKGPLLGSWSVDEGPLPQWPVEKELMTLLISREELPYIGGQLEREPCRTVVSGKSFPYTGGQSKDFPITLVVSYRQATIADT